jgi:xylulokinase
VTRAYLGVDVGTRSTKAVALDAEGAVLTAAAVDHPVLSRQPGHFEHDATQVWWLGVVAAIRSLLTALPAGVTVEGLGLSCCGPCFVPVDESGTPLRDGILYGVDTRAAAQVSRLEQEIGADSILADFGMPLTSQSIGPKIDWLAEVEPDIYAATAHLLPANSFAAWHLTGEMRIDHHQAAYFAPYYRAGGWDRTHDRCGVVDRLPALAWSQDVVGHVSTAAAAETGLPQGLPVILGSSDGLTAAYGSGAVEEGSAVLNYGSTLGLTVMTSQASRPGGVWITPGASPGQLCLAAGLATGGALATWFIDRFARELGNSDEAYRVLAEEAERSSPGANGLLLLPYFAGERTPFYDPGAAGALVGLRLAHTRGDLYRAVLEGTGFGVRHLLEELSSMGVAITALRAVGGGTRTPLWQQIVSDISGVTQQVVASHHGAAAGAAVLALLATGAAIGPAAWELAPESIVRLITPTATLTSLYEQRYRLFRETYERTRPVIDGLDPPG